MTAHIQPGPKYMLPSTVGTENRDIRIKRSPTYVLGARFPLPTDRRTMAPSPLVYNCCGMTAKGPVKIYGGNLGTKLDQKKKIRLSPGPDVYFPDFRVDASYKNPPAFSLGAKRRDSRPKGSLTPAANAYMIPHTIGTNTSIMKNSPAYSVLGKVKPRKTLVLSPSSGQYPAVNCDIFKKKAPEFSIKGKPKRRGLLVPIPAPNAYKPSLIDKKTIPSYVFGVKGKAKVPDFAFEKEEDLNISDIDD